MELVVDVVEVVVLDIMEARLEDLRLRQMDLQVAELQMVAQILHLLQVEAEWGLRECHQQQEVMVAMEKPFSLEVLLTHLLEVEELEVEMALRQD